MPDQEPMLEKADAGASQAIAWDCNLPALEVDVEKYRAYVRDFNLTEDQEGQLIRAYWQVMMAFVDIGFGIHPAQQAIQARQLDEVAGDSCNDFSNGGPVSLAGMLQCIIEKADDLRDEFSASAKLVDGQA